MSQQEQDRCLVPTQLGASCGDSSLGGSITAGRQRTEDVSELHDSESHLRRLQSNPSYDLHPYGASGRDGATSRPPSHAEPFQTLEDDCRVLKQHGERAISYREQCRKLGTMADEIVLAAKAACGNAVTSEMSHTLSKALSEAHGEVCQASTLIDVHGMYSRSKKYVKIYASSIHKTKLEQQYQRLCSVHERLWSIADRFQQQASLPPPAAPESATAQRDGSLRAPQRAGSARASESGSTAMMQNMPSWRIGTPAPDDRSLMASLSGRHIFSRTFSGRTFEVGLPRHSFGSRASSRKLQVGHWMAKPVTCLLYLDNTSRPESQGVVWWWSNNAMHEHDIHGVTTKRFEAKVQDKMLGAVKVLAFDLSCHFVWAGHEDGTVSIWREATGVMLATAPAEVARKLKEVRAIEPVHPFAVAVAGEGGHILLLRCEGLALASTASVAASTSIDGAAGKARTPDSGRPLEIVEVNSLKAARSPGPPGSSAQSLQAMVSMESNGGAEPAVDHSCMPPMPARRGKRAALMRNISTILSVRRAHHHHSSSFGAASEQQSPHRSASGAASEPIPDLQPALSMERQTDSGLPTAPAHMMVPEDGVMDETLVSNRAILASPFLASNTPNPSALPSTLESASSLTGSSARRSSKRPSLDAPASLRGDALEPRLSERGSMRDGGGSDGDCASRRFGKLTSISHALSHAQGVGVLRSMRPSLLRWEEESRMYETAHEGPIISILSMGQYIFTSSASSICDAQIRMWVEGMDNERLQYGLHDTFSCTSNRAARSMTTIPWPASVSKSVHGTPGAALKSWRLLTGHDSGNILMFDPSLPRLQPILCISFAQNVPVRNISYMKPFGLLAISCTDGLMHVINSFTPDSGIMNNALDPTKPTLFPDELGKVQLDESGWTFALHDKRVDFVSVARSKGGVASGTSRGAVMFWPPAFVEHEAIKAGLTLAHMPSMELASQSLERQDSKQDGALIGGDKRSAMMSTNLEDDEDLVDAKDIVLKRYLGDGGFGTVREGSLHHTRVAVKIIKTPQVRGILGDAINASRQGTFDTSYENFSRDLAREVKILKKVRHPNVVFFRALCLHPPMIVTELCEHGSLFDVISAYHKPRSAYKHRADIVWCERLTWPVRVNLMADTAKGMAYLHQRRLLHCDLKSPNLLVHGSSELVCKVADFGLSRFVAGKQDTQAALGQSANNPMWQAPEVALKPDECSRSGDVYAFGIVMWEVLMMQPPWQGMHLFMVANAVQSGERPDVPSDLTKIPGTIGSTPLPQVQQYIDLMTRCWSQDPELRPPFDSVVPLLDAMVARLGRAQREEEDHDSATVRNFDSAGAGQPSAAELAAPPGMSMSSPFIDGASVTKSPVSPADAAPPAAKLKVIKERGARSRGAVVHSRSPSVPRSTAEEDPADPAASRVVYILPRGDKRHHNRQQGRVKFGNLGQGVRVVLPAPAAAVAARSAARAAAASGTLPPSRSLQEYDLLSALAPSQGSHHQANAGESELSDVYRETLSMPTTTPLYGPRDGTAVSRAPIGHPRGTAVQDCGRPAAAHGASLCSPESPPTAFHTMSPFDMEPMSRTSSAVNGPNGDNSSAAVHGSRQVMSSSGSGARSPPAPATPARSLDQHAFDSRVATAAGVRHNGASAALARNPSVHLLASPFDSEPGSASQPLDARTTSLVHARTAMAVSPSLASPFDCEPTSASPSLEVNALHAQSARAAGPGSWHVKPHAPTMSSSSQGGADESAITIALPSMFDSEPQSASLDLAAARQPSVSAALHSSFDREPPSASLDLGAARQPPALRTAPVQSAYPRFTAAAVFETAQERVAPAQFAQFGGLAGQRLSNAQAVQDTVQDTMRMSSLEQPSFSEFLYLGAPTTAASARDASPDPPVVPALDSAFDCELPGASAASSSLLATLGSAFDSQPRSATRCVLPPIAAASASDSCHTPSDSDAVVARLDSVFEGAQLPFPERAHSVCAVHHSAFDRQPRAAHSLSPAAPEASNVTLHERSTSVLPCHASAFDAQPHAAAVSGVHAPQPWLLDLSVQPELDSAAESNTLPARADSVLPAHESAFDTEPRNVLPARLASVLLPQESAFDTEPRNVLPARAASILATHESASDFERCSEMSARAASVLPAHESAFDTEPRNVLPARLASILLPQESAFDTEPRNVLPAARAEDMQPAHEPVYHTEPRNMLPARSASVLPAHESAFDTEPRNVLPERLTSVLLAQESAFDTEPLNVLPARAEDMQPAHELVYHTEPRNMLPARSASILPAHESAFDTEPRNVLPARLASVLLPQESAFDTEPRNVLPVRAASILATHESAFDFEPCSEMSARAASVLPAHESAFDTEPRNVLPERAASVLATHESAFDFEPCSELSARAASMLPAHESAFDTEPRNVLPASNLPAQKAAVSVEPCGTVLAGAASVVPAHESAFDTEPRNVLPARAASVLPAHKSAFDTEPHNMLLQRVDSVLPAHPSAFDHEPSSQLPTQPQSALPSLDSGYEAADESTCQWAQRQQAPVEAAVAAECQLPRDRITDVGAPSSAPSSAPPARGGAPRVLTSVQSVAPPVVYVEGRWVEEGVPVTALPRQVAFSVGSSFGSERVSCTGASFGGACMPIGESSVPTDFSSVTEGDLL